MGFAYVDVTLDKQRKIRYGIRELRDLERVLGKPVGEVLADFAKLGADSLAAVLWAGLKHEDKRLSIDAALDLIDAYLTNGGELGDLRAAINEALVLSGYFGKKAKEQVEADRPQKADG
jgi:hypothetical protein